jgi:hypothetical protein
MLFNAIMKTASRFATLKREVKKERREVHMTTYAHGYWAGWMSYLEGYPRKDSTFEMLLADANTLAEQAGHSLTPQGDYWLGYHHGRAAAKTRVTKHVRM